MSQSSEDSRHSPEVELQKRRTPVKSPLLKAPPSPLAPENKKKSNVDLGEGDLQRKSRSPLLSPPQQIKSGMVLESRSEW